MTSVQLCVVPRKTCTSTTKHRGEHDCMKEGTTEQEQEPVRIQRKKAEMANLCPKKLRGNSNFTMAKFINRHHGLR